MYSPLVFPNQQFPKPDIPLPYSVAHSVRFATFLRYYEDARLLTAWLLAPGSPWCQGYLLDSWLLARLGLLDSLLLLLGVGLPVSPHHFRFFLSWKKLDASKNSPGYPFGFLP